MIMYSAILPELKRKNGKDGKDEVINADDPRNREVYLKFVNSK